MIRIETYPSSPLVNIYWMNELPLFFFWTICFYFYRDIQNGLGTVSVSYLLRKHPFQASWDSFLGFSFSWSCCFAGSSLLRSTAEWPLLGGEFPHFWGGHSCFWLFRVTNWFLAGEEFNLLEGFPLPAVSWRSILTSSSLETDFLFLGLERDGSSLPFSCGASWGFCFFF